MGKIIAREFLWLLVALIMAIPLGLIFLWFFGSFLRLAGEMEPDEVWKAPGAFSLIKHMQTCE